MSHKQGFYEKYIKRPQDFLCAAGATVVLSPVMGITALIVQKKLGSPVLFTQDRPGLNGRVFKLYKFRTMTDERDADGNLLPDSIRLTSFGKKLRSTSLDELPELFNILKGDMAVVGPRPLLVKYLPRYNEHQARRHEVRPGFTGLAQVHGRNAISWEEKFDWDVRYVDHISFLGDWKIIFETVKTVLKREGINAAGEDTMGEFMGSGDNEKSHLNVLFLTLVGFETLQSRNIYTDLLREFTKNGHHVYVISPIEKRQNKETHLVKEENAEILRLQIGNTQKTNIVEKGISTIMIEPAYKKAIDQYFSKVKFDLVLYSTPPITLVSAIEYAKERDGAKTYLLLKDIFPQNAVDIGLMSKFGIKGLLYRFFRNKEKKLYQISDRIGCMSQANVEYLLRHNPEIAPDITEVCPNSIEVLDKSVDIATRWAIRKKYGIPQEKTIFVYGGNLGKPQGIPFLIECFRKCADIEDAYFLIIGDGTERHLLQAYIDQERPQNVCLMKSLPKEDYDSMVGACDVGMIFLDHRFTIPNFPSRLLSYMQAKIPVLACTDPNTDIGKVITESGFGWWCESNDSDVFYKTINTIMELDIKPFGMRAFEYLRKRYRAEQAYNTIIEHYKM